MYSFTEREANLIGKENVELLAAQSVAVFGLGGVGSYCVEALVRAGIGRLLICDGDVVAESNLNRQLYALRSTVGQSKVAVAAKRIKDINPDIELIEKPIFYNKETEGEFDLSTFDYIVDCIDNVTSKIMLVERAKCLNKSIIACLGTGNKLDNTRFEVADIYKTSVCPLAKVMRRELKKRGIESLKVVYSKEEPRLPLCEDKRTPASISFVPPVAGMVIAGEVIRDLLR